MVLLPEDKYNKSGFELEMMEEEARDSEEAEDYKLGQSGGRNRKQSPLSSKIGNKSRPDQDSSFHSVPLFGPRRSFMPPPPNPLIYFLSLYRMMAFSCSCSPSVSFSYHWNHVGLPVGISKKIKIFEFSALCNDSVDIHYPAVEISNRSKLSCVCWNNYIKNYLASTDYDGIVKVMYRPLKDLDGRPGAKDLIMCLTGYQRQDWDAIMTMVGLMGAQLSKPLMANKVTHLICYKFEGEKYELAKKLGTIKLVNHRWLEDCLKEWVLLPEDKYNKSGFELEMMEEEAKDSEEEAEDSTLGQSRGRNRKQSPLSSKIGIAATPGLSKSLTAASNALPDSTGPQVLPNVNSSENSLTVPGNKSSQDSSFHNIDDSKVSYQAADISRHSTSCQLPDKYVKTCESKNADSPKAPGCQDLGNMGNTNSSDQQPDLHGDISVSKKVACDLRATSASAAGAVHSNEKLSKLF